MRCVIFALFIDIALVVGLPAEAIAILLPIDRLPDTVRTVVNVEGDLIGSLVVNELIKADHLAKT